MAIEKYVKDLVAKAITNDATRDDLVEIKHPPAVKYKAWHKTQKDKHPDLAVGKKIIVLAKESSTVKGYMLCLVLDYQTEKGSWNSRTMVIMQVQKVSHESLGDAVGRLIACKLENDGWWFSEQYSIHSFDRSKFKWL